MQATIIDSDVKGVVVVFKDDKGERSPWYMRMVASTIVDTFPDQPYLWYVIAEKGWESVCNSYGPEAEKELEAAYQEQL